MEDKNHELLSEEHMDSTAKLVKGIEHLDEVAHKSLVGLMLDDKVPMEIAIPVMHRTGGDPILEEMGIKMPVKPEQSNGFLLAAHEINDVITIITMDPYESGEYPYRVCIWVSKKEWMDSIDKMYRISSVPFTCLFEQAGRSISFPMILARMLFEEWPDGPEGYTNVKLHLQPCGILDFTE